MRRQTATAATVENRLRGFLASETELARFDGAVFNTGAGGEGVNLDLLFRWLLNRTYEKGPREAAAALARWVSLGTNPGTHYLAVHGVRVDRPLKLARGVSLLPLERVPQSIASIAAGRRLDEWTRPYAISTAVLAQRWAVQPQIWDPEKPASAYGMETLEWARRGLTLVGPSCPTPIFTWWRPDNWVPMANLLGETWSPLLPEGLAASELAVVGAVRDEARRVLRTLASADDVTERRLRIPLIRLNRAMRRRDLVDKAIDLGIAFEALLLSDLSSRGELAFRLRVRGARAAGADVEGRLKIASLLKELYVCRSIAVHEGELSQRRALRLEAIVEECIRLVVVLVLRFASGGYPDWDRVLFE